jgi:putative FmdB family regulatory protein
MPLYEYQCDACEHRFEKIQKFSDPLVDVCPKCGKGPVRKLLSSPAIQFKGSGFYINDYAKKSSSSESSTSTKSTSTESAAETKKSEPAAASTPSEKSSDKKD